MSDVVLVMLSFAFLVVFSHRIAVSIQTQNVVAHIVADLDAALAELGTLFRQLGPRAWPLMDKGPTSRWWVQSVGLLE